MDRRVAVLAMSSLVSRVIEVMGCGMGDCDDEEKMVVR